MCGIYGWIGDTTQRSKVFELFENLGIESESRGKHATGYYSLNGSVTSAKAPLPASDFFKIKAYKDLYSKSTPHVLIGHNRWATHGNPKDNRNNHPFTTNRWGFIHNGNVANTIDISTYSDCDSEKIFRFFTKDYYNSHSALNSIEKVLKTFDRGDMACALADAKTDSLYLFRNDGRPLVKTFLEDLNIIVFASTKEILERALKKSKIKYDNDKIYSLKVGQILRIRRELKIKSRFVEGLHKTTIITKANYPVTNYPIALPRYNWLPKPKTKTYKRGWECKLCKKVFIGEEWLDNHIWLEHGKIDTDKYKKYL